MDGTGPFVIGINGPPQIGKGWLAAKITQLLPFNSRIMSITETMREEAMTRDKWVGTYEEFKKHVFADGQNGRERMIQLGNAKRAMNINYFTQKLTESPKFNDPSTPIIVVDDLGFFHEPAWLNQHCCAMMLIVIAPPEYCVGALYNGDSRVCLNHHNGIRAPNSSAALEKFKKRLANASDYESTVNSKRLLWFEHLLDRSMD